MLHGLVQAAERRVEVRNCWFATAMRAIAAGNVLRYFGGAAAMPASCSKPSA